MGENYKEESMPCGHFEALLGQIVLKPVNSKLWIRLPFLLLLGCTQGTAGKSIRKELEEQNQENMKEVDLGCRGLPLPQRLACPIVFFLSFFKRDFYKKLLCIFYLFILCILCIYFRESEHKLEQGERQREKQTPH